MTTPTTSTAASAAWPSPSSAPWAWRSEPDAPAFPAAGALLLLVLLSVAVWAWWRAARRGQVGPLRGWPWPAQPDATGREGAPRVLSATRLDASTRLYVVRWHEHDLLLGVTGQSPPVVLDRRGRSAAEDTP